MGLEQSAGFVTFAESHNLWDLLLLLLLLGGGARRCCGAYGRTGRMGKIAEDMNERVKVEMPDTKMQVG